MLTGKSILITGGTGSFGRRYARTLIERHSPARIVIYSRDELKQFEMRQDFHDDAMRWFIGDVRDRDRLGQAMKGIDFVIHAAALKHVPVAEYNPMEAIKTNVLGAQNVIETALEADVERVIALSTDKAASPINLYGATKLCSDKLFVAANNLVGKGRTRFAVTRYGNVAGSRGSVLPYFLDLLNQGTDHLPLTDERMTRFWITLQEGVDFVLSNFERMHGGEIFIPKIPSVRIKDLARALAPELPTRIVGIRPGEKLHEVMVPEDDAHLALDFGDHYVIEPSIKYYGRDVDCSINAKGEKGHPLPEGFVYSSRTNERFLSVEELASYRQNPPLPANGHPPIAD